MVLKNLASLRAVGARMIVGTDAGKPRLIYSMQATGRSADIFYHQESDYVALSDMLMACSFLKKLGTRRERSFKVPQMYVPPKVALHL